MVAAGLVRYAGRDVMGGYVEPPDDLKIDNFSGYEPAQVERVGCTSSVKKKKEKDLQDLQKL